MDNLIIQKNISILSKTEIKANLNEMGHVVTHEQLSQCYTIDTIVLLKILNALKL